MVPYIYIPDGHIGPLPLHPFGVLVATGVLLGTAMTTRRARRLGWDVAKLNSFVTWMLVSAFVLSHVLDSLFYHWDEVVKNPFGHVTGAFPYIELPYVLQLWAGLSSFGGFVGAAVGIVLWKYLFIDNGRLRVRPTPAPLLPFADLVLSCLPLGWMFGRAGCASVHDHPGARATADSLLAVAWPMHFSVDPTTGTYTGDGTSHHVWFVQLIWGHAPRFDLGFLEFLFTVILCAAFAATWHKKVPLGSYMIVTALTYAPVRFAMDYLRIPASEGGDTRYLGLTPAQHCCFILFAFGIVMIFYMRRLKARGIDPTLAVRAPPPEPEQATPTVTPA
jgi:phosphatidylglycerol:prolipoprotein diacylglycerol transferase